MELMFIASSIILCSVLLTIINKISLKLPVTVAIMLATATISLICIIASKFYLPTLDSYLKALLINIDFSKLLLEFMLGYLLFAGALTIDINDLKKSFKEILALATCSTIISTILTAILLYWLIIAINQNFNIAIHLSFNGCLLFAALISPTDPIAVLGILKTMKAPKSIETKLAGESLFNDGVGIVIFLTIYQLTYDKNTTLNLYNISTLFLQQAIGGLLYGTILGFIIQKLINITDDAKLHILITIAIVTFGYTISHNLHISGPLAMVITGIMVNLNNKKYKLPIKSKQSLHQFWEIIDELLNLILFFLLGAELIILDIALNKLLIIILIIPTVLFARITSVYLPIKAFGLIKNQIPYTTRLLTWGGLRGGLAIALALSLPNSNDKSLILALTYSVVFFSIIIQGTTVKKIVYKMKKAAT